VRRVRTTNLLPLVLATLLAACGGEETATGGRPVVVATTSILGDIAGVVAGGEAEVKVLMPRGTDPHEFSPSPRQVALLGEADLVVANGLGLEEGLADALASVGEEAGNVLEVAPQVDPLPLPEEGGEHEDEEHEGEGLDPHVWMDPVRMADAAGLIAERLAAARPGGWAGRADRYAEELAALDDEIREVLAPIPPDRRVLVTNHDVLGYLAARYDLEVLGVIIPGGSTLGEPSAGAFSELAALIRERDVPAIFAETTQPSALAETLAGEVGRAVEIVELFTESLGPEGSGADTYAGMMRANARRIARGLG